MTASPSPVFATSYTIPTLQFTNLQGADDESLVAEY